MGRSIATLSSGVEGLDELLRGGYIRGRMYLVYGRPGAGKTLLGMHFLQEGLEAGETVLYIHGEESREEVLVNGGALGIDVSDAEFLDLGPDSDFFTESYSYDLVNPGDVERDQYIEDIHGAIRDIGPDRVVVDPITQLRYVEANEYEFRKRILSFMRFLKHRNITVLATETPSFSEGAGTELRSVSDGIIELTSEGGRRRIEVSKHRGCGQLSGDHGMEIREGGIEVFPHLVFPEENSPFTSELLRFGIDELDDLCGGGFNRQTVTFITGPTGVGKTTTGTQMLIRGAEDGLRSGLYLFEERIGTCLHRCDSIDIPLREAHEEGTVSITSIRPGRHSAEEFALMVKRQVERQGLDVVMIDGLDGYVASIQGGSEKLTQELTTLTHYLTSTGVTVLVTNEIPQITGISTAAKTSLSYVADNLAFVSYVEMDGSLRKIVGVLKKRTGGFEHTIREFEITSDGIEVGEPLTGLYGILQGTPRRGESEGI